MLGFDDEMSTEGGGVFRLTPDGEAPVNMGTSEISTDSTQDDQPGDGTGEEQVVPEGGTSPVKENDNKTRNLGWILAALFASGLIYCLFSRR